MTERLEDHGSEGRRLSGLAASKEISERLTVAARKLRFSTSSRSSLYQAVGLRPRLMDRLFTFSLIALTVLLLILPVLGGILYFGFLASDQYESETRFTVRSATPALGKDQIGKVTGIPAAKIVQDTQIVVNFITSHEILRMMDGDLDLHRIYGATTTDWFARLPADATAEETLEYWQGMVTTSISPSSGIVTVRAKAFSPEDAQRIVQLIIEKSEVVVNQVNDRIWKDVIATAQENLENATTQLQEARATLANARNENGVLSVDGSSQVITALLATIEAERISLQQRYDTSRSSVSEDAPQMRVLRREIESKEQQIAELNSRVAGEAKMGRNLAQISQDLSQFELAQDLAESQFASSVKTLEQVQFVSQQQLLYLDSFLEPRIPDEAQYPRRGLWITLTIVFGLIGWGLSIGLLYFARNQLSH
ncbi:capsular polysaccharide transport system permease protein [Rhizobium sp. RU33A]|uniref:capsule biosynthesis protein n=1 Tax=Rhizobium sp. RU33A TaxID=1907413 RepID=UPI000953AA46|nr:capsule biosynthesis protein [Rhizobium sp. RU33A]SIR14137.1 capsular polysaccharide transport system permease protein [Rhizobium sp. RU33A]